MELGFVQEGATTLYGDNQSSLSIAKNPQYHQRSKYFNIKNHYICDKIHNNIICAKYCPTAKMTVDIFTKALPKPKHFQHTMELGLSSA
jgi:hypothetical protein